MSNDDLEPYPLVGYKDSQFYDALHSLLLDRLIIREPALENYRDELHVVTRNAHARNTRMVLPVGTQVHDGHLYLNIEMSADWPIRGIAPGAFFKYNSWLKSMVVEDKHQLEADMRPRNIRKLMGR